MLSMLLRRSLRALLLTGLVYQIGSLPLAAQVRVNTLEELREKLSIGDEITLVQKSGQSLKGRLLRFGATELEIRREMDVTDRDRRRIDTKIPLETVQSVDRRKDSTKNGALIGMGVGAGVTLGQFAWAYAVDRNEFDEWGAEYIGVGAAYVGIGALIGIAIDSAHSKPIRFDASPEARLKLRFTPVLAHNNRGVAFAVSF